MLIKTMEKELRLDYCDVCVQMTNHLNDESEVQSKKKWNQSLPRLRN